ncbi:MAG: T9SS type A sorting domain-containing protein [Bacteroidota bacterium]
MNIHLRLGLIICFLIIAFKPAPAQVNINNNPCGTEVPSEDWNNEFQKLVQERKLAQQGNKSQQALFTIPVIVHVIHGGQSVGSYPNLAQGQINSQIIVLNNDFAGTGYNSSNYPATAYANWAIAQGIQLSNVDANGRIKIADCGVEFCLATKDTLGNTLAEPGIDRINYVSRGWSNPTSFATNAALKSYVDGVIKPQTIWNVSKYMNIWISDRDPNLGGGLLGYATFPPLTGLSGLSGPYGSSTTDGFWCYSKCFGSTSTYPSGTYMSGYNRGRTSTHEIGHYMGLRHIWGDGVCASDYCLDTPSGSASNFGSPNYPYKTTSCAGNQPDGEMYMNFMDYTDDPAKYMFTTDQAFRVQTALTNSPYRKFLGTHGVCGQIPVLASFSNGFLACPGVALNLSNTSSGFPAPSYTWTSTGGVLSNPNAASPSITFSAPGTYVVTLMADNGTTSVISKTITVTSPAMSLSASASNICPGGSVNLSASGVNSYTWQPGGINFYMATYSPTQSQVFTCYGSQMNGCQATATISVIVDACTGVKEAAGDLRFNIYPNPAKDALHIAYYSEKNTDVNVEVIDALGKQVLTQEFEFGKNKQNQSLNITMLANGVYFVKLKSGTAAPQFIKLVKE